MPITLKGLSMPRSRRRQLTERLYVRTLQILRFEGLEAGRIEPASDRERLYLLLFRAGSRPDRNDFIVSVPLLRLESILVELEQERVAPGPPFTPPPEPAISPG